MTDLEFTPENADTEKPLPDIFFNDSAGTRWKIKLTVGLIEDIQEETQVNMDLMIQEPKKFSELILAAPKKLVQIFWVICEEQAKANDIDPKTFGRRFDRVTLDRATDALIESIVDFYPRGAAGATLRGNLPALLKAMDAEIAKRAEREMRKGLQALSNMPTS